MKKNHGNLEFSNFLMEIEKLYNLKVGDRFFFLTDRSRKVWQIDFIEYSSRMNSFNKEVEKIEYYLKDDNNLIKKEKKNLTVKYLRSLK